MTQGQWDDYKDDYGLFVVHNRFRCLFIPDCIVKTDKLTNMEKLVFGRLFQYAYRDGVCTPRRSSLCKELGVKYATVDRAISKLKSLGFIHTTQPDMTYASKYEFLYHPMYDGSIRDISADDLHYGAPFNPYGRFYGILLPNCLARTNLLPTEKIVLGRLLQYAGAKGKAFPLNRELGEATNTGLRALKQAISNLRKFQLIKVEMNAVSCKTYYFIEHPLYKGMSVTEQQGDNGFTGGAFLFDRTLADTTSDDTEDEGSEHGVTPTIRGGAADDEHTIRSFTKRSFAVLRTEKDSVLRSATPTSAKDPIYVASKIVKRIFAKKEVVVEDESVGNCFPAAVSRTEHKNQLAMLHARGLSLERHSKSTRELSDLTVELITYWNEQPYLKQHPLHKSPRTGRYPFDSQLKYIQNADGLLVRLFSGKLYTNCKDILEVPYRTIPITKEMFKLVIRKFASEGDASYGGVKGAERVTKMDLGAFLYSGHSEILQDMKKGTRNTWRYKFKYPFLHYFAAVPQKVSDTSGSQKASSYPLTVASVIEMLKSNNGYMHNIKNWNAVVRAVDSAAQQIKAAGATDSFREIMGMLDKCLYDCMAGRIHVDELYTATEYRLLPSLRKKRFVV